MVLTDYFDFSLPNIFNIQIFPIFSSLCICSFVLSFKNFYTCLEYLFILKDQLNKEPYYFLDTGSFTFHFYYLYLEFITKFSVNVR